MWGGRSREERAQQPQEAQGAPHAQPCLLGMGFRGPLLLERATWRAPLALTPHSESLARSVAGSVRQGQTLLQRRWPKAPLDRASKNQSAAVAMRRAASLEYDHREENPKPTDLNQVLNRGRGESIHKGMLQHGRASCSMLKRNRAYANEAQMSMSTAEKYARRARNSADSLEDVAYNIACAIDALVQAIRDLEARVKRLESKMR